MTTETTSTLTNAIRALYYSKYLDAALPVRVYDQVSSPVQKDEIVDFLGSTYTFNFIADLPAATSALSQTADITPRITQDATVSITPTSRGDAIQVSEALLLQAYTDYGAKRHELIGRQMMESVDLLAQAAALQGTNVLRATVSRVTLDAGNTAHNLSDINFHRAQERLETMKVPSFDGIGGKQWAAIMTPAVYGDLLLNTGGHLLATGEYSQPGLILNWEVGSLGPFKIVSTPWAKTFYGAASANGTTSTTTLGAACLALATSLNVTTSTSMTVGGRLVIGTAETGNTHYQTNEQVWISSITNGTKIVIIGEGPNGGTRFAHDNGTAVDNAYNVYPVVFGGPISLAKVYAENEYGTVVGPKRQGLLDQFESLGWKWYGNYGRIAESRILRVEVSASSDHE